MMSGPSDAKLFDLIVERLNLSIPCHQHFGRYKLAIPALTRP